MKLRFLFWTVSLAALLVLSACASAAPSATVLLPTDTPTPTPASSASQPVALTPTSIPIQAIATSRGPNLEATDPSTVSLASGQLQLVEFFRFT